MPYFVHSPLYIIYVYICNNFKQCDKTNFSPEIACQKHFDNSYISKWQGLCYCDGVLWFQFASYCLIHLHFHCFLSVNVFSMKLLIGDTFFYVSNWRQDCRFVVIRATWWSSHFHRAKEVPSFLSYFKTLCIGLALGIIPMTSCSAVKPTTDWAYPAAVDLVKYP